MSRCRCTDAPPPFAGRRITTACRVNIRSIVARESTATPTGGFRSNSSRARFDPHRGCGPPQLCDSHLHHSRKVTRARQGAATDSQTPPHPDHIRPTQACTDCRDTQPALPSPPPTPRTTPPASHPTHYSTTDDMTSANLSLPRSDAHGTSPMRITDHRPTSSGDTRLSSITRHRTTSNVKGSRAVPAAANH
jgi:hypothetical protein